MVSSASIGGNVLSAESFTDYAKSTELAGFTSTFIPKKTKKQVKKEKDEFYEKNIKPYIPRKKNK